MKTFFQFMSESGGSPGKPYIPQPGPSKPTQPEEGFDEFRRKYGLPPKNPVKLAKAIREDSGRRKQYEQERKERRRPAAVKATDPDLAKLSYMLNQDRPGR
jgi:hypothetical protein